MTETIKTNVEVHENEDRGRWEDEIRMSGDVAFGPGSYPDDVFERGELKQEATDFAVNQLPEILRECLAEKKGFCMETANLVFEGNYEDYGPKFQEKINLQIKMKKV